MARKDRKKPPRRRGHDRSQGHLVAVPDQGPPPLGPEQQELVTELRRGLRSSSPLDLLAWVSAMVEVGEPRSTPLPGADEPPDLDTLVESFEAVAFSEATAALRVIHALTRDAELKARIARALMRRRHPLPTWLSRLDEARVDGDVLRLTEPLNDGVDIFVPVRFAGGEELTGVVFIDHNHGGPVKDGFAIPEPLHVVVEHFHNTATTPGVRLQAVDAADARATIEQALELGASFLPGFESETWPTSRPLIEWIVGLLPAGGHAPEQREWTEADVAEAVEAFLASPRGQALDVPDKADLAELAMNFAAFHAGGDPLRWSPQRLSMLLLDWVPRKVVAPQDYLAGLPAVLAALVPYAHETNVVPAPLTQQTLAALTEMTVDYRELLDDDDRALSPGLEALLGTLGLEGIDDLEGMDPSDLAELIAADASFRPGIGPLMLDSLAVAVGGTEQLWQLDAEPLPDEPFDWSLVPDDVQPTVAEWVQWCDRCADELFDVEHRTVFRRFLARAVSGDPAIFRRRASVARGAAAVVWAVGKANLSVGWDGGVAVKDLMAFFDQTGSPGQRAEPLVRAVGADPGDPWYALGDAALLVAARRAEIIADRDRWTAGPQ